jgi:hypothetical protein
MYFGDKTWGYRYKGEEEFELEIMEVRICKITTLRPAMDQQRPLSGDIRRSPQLTVLYYAKMAFTNMKSA